MSKVYRFLLSLNFWLYILLFVTIIVLIELLYMQLPQVDLGASPEQEALTTSVFKSFFALIIIAPIFETLLFQMLIIRGLGWLLKRTTRVRYGAWYLMPLSALLFAVNHPYNWSLIIFTFIGGLILAFAYRVARKRRQSAFLTVAIIHACLNFIPFCQDIINGRIADFF